VVDGRRIVGEPNALYDIGHKFGEDFKAVAPLDCNPKTNLAEIVECGSRLQPALNRRFDEAMKTLHDPTEIRTFLNGFCAGFNGRTRAY
jgi:hypothetical protein